MCLFFAFVVEGEGCEALDARGPLPAVVWWCEDCAVSWVSRHGITHPGCCSFASRCGCGPVNECDDKRRLACKSCCTEHVSNHKVFGTRVHHLAHLLLCNRMRRRGRKAQRSCTTHFVCCTAVRSPGSAPVTAGFAFSGRFSCASRITMLTAVYLSTP